MCTGLPFECSLNATSFSLMFVTVSITLPYLICTAHAHIQREARQARHARSPFACVQAHQRQEGRLARSTQTEEEDAVAALLAPEDGGHEEEHDQEPTYYDCQALRHGQRHAPRLQRLFHRSVDAVAIPRLSMGKGKPTSTIPCIL